MKMIINTKNSPNEYINFLLNKLCPDAVDIIIKFLLDSNNHRIYYIPVHINNHIVAPIITQFDWIINACLWIESFDKEYNIIDIEHSNEYMYSGIQFYIDGPEPYILTNYKRIYLQVQVYKNLDYKDRPAIIMN